MSRSGIRPSGTSRSGRTELETLLAFLQAGDTLVITRIDRLARSVKDLQDVLHELCIKGVTLKATEQPIDTSTAAGKAFLDMLGVFAESRQTFAKSGSLRASPKRRRMASIAEGSRRSTRMRCGRWRRKGWGKTEIAERLKIARASVYRLLKAEAA